MLKSKMECRQDKNLADCSCSHLSCSRRGKCCECLKHHLKKKELPGCCFPKEAEASFDRSFGKFVECVQKKKI